MKKIILILIMFSIISYNAIAVDPVISGQIDMLSPEQFDKYLNDQGDNLVFDKNSKNILLDIVSGKGIGDTAQIIKSLLSYFLKESALGLRSAVQIIVVIIISATISAIAGQENNKSVGAITSIVCAMAVVVIAAGAFKTLADGGLLSIKHLTDMIRLMMPIMAALLAGSAMPVSAAAYPAVIMLVCGIANEIMRGVILPLIYCYIALSAADCAFLSGRFCKLCDAIKSLVNWTLTISVSLFAGLLTIQGSSGKIADTLTLRVTRFAIGSFVPVVGKAISDAYDTVYACAGAVRTAFGTFGIVLCICICLTPLLKSLIHCFIFKILSAAAGLFESRELSNVLTAFSTAFSMLFSMTAGIGLLFIIGISMIAGRGG